MLFSTFFFDLDDTLYASSSGLWDAIRERMSEFMVERVGLPAVEVPALRRYYFETYGTTLRGLQKHYGVDADEYLAYVHDLPLERYLQPAPELGALLKSLPGRRWIFTNADANHAGRVLATLGLTGCFEGIVDVRAAQFACKPEPEAYRQAMRLAGEAEAQGCVMLDDSRRNLAPARALGFTTVLVGTTEPDPAATYSVASLLALPQVAPELWDGARRGDGYR